MRGHLMRRTAAAVLGGVLLSCAALTLVGAQAADAVTGYHVTASPSLNARGGPGTGYGIVGSVGYGAGIDIACQVQGGTNVGGNATWDRLSNGWWVSDYWTSTPSFNSYIPGVPDCNNVVAPPPATIYHATGSPYTNARGGPGSGYSVVGTIPAGTAITISCQTQGGTDVHGNATWDRLSNGWWITDYWTDTPSFNSFAPGLSACDSSNPPTTSSVGEQAARWAQARIGQVYTTENPNAPYWSGWCEAFVGISYGRRFHFASAIAHFNAWNSAGYIHGGVPPRGAVVFYNIAPNGHVAIGVGNGQVVSTMGYSSNPVAVAQHAYTYFGHYLGWAMPY
jgi:uncharacterized protein YraI